MSKRYYWLKLPEHFFDDDTIQFIEEQPNGVEYSNFYLKLCLKSLRNNGVLVRTVGDLFIPYDIPSLAKMTGVNVDTVRSAMALLTKIGLVKIQESGEIYLTRIDEMVGSETDKAALMRRKRENDRIDQKKTEFIEEGGNNVTDVLPERYTENRDKSSENRVQSTENRDKSLDSKNLDNKDLKPIKESEEKKPKRKRFAPPSLDEVQSYITEKGFNVDAERFISYYESNGWMVGRNHMKDWKATVRNWNAREKSGGGYQKKPYQTARQAASEATYNFYMKQILEGEDEPEGNGSDNHENVWGMAR